MTGIPFRWRNVAGAGLALLVVAFPWGSQSNDFQPPSVVEGGVRFSGAEYRDGKYRLILQIPDGYPGRVDVFRTDDLLSGRWQLAAPDEAITGTVHEIWLDPTPGPSFYISDSADHDADGDGIPDGREKRIFRTNPALADTDGDGMQDGWEIGHGLNALLNADGDDDADNDGLSNRDEYLLGTNPRKRDTDDDGLDDFTEINWKTVCAWGGQ